MAWVRNRWAGRVCATVLLLSMLPTLAVPTNRMAGDAQFGSYERWIRNQIRVPVDAAVEKAIAEAVASDAESFDSFIATFLDAFGEVAPDRPLSQVFTDRELSDDALISFLQRRYSQIADEGVVPRVYVASFIHNLLVSGKSGLDAARKFSADMGRADRGSFMPPVVEKTIVISLRTLTSARSLGP